MSVKEITSVRDDSKDDVEPKNPPADNQKKVIVVLINDRANATGSSSSDTWIESDRWYQGFNVIISFDKLSVEFGKFFTTRLSV